MRSLVVLALLGVVGCPPPPPSYVATYAPPSYAQPEATQQYDLTKAGQTVDRMIEFAFEGGRLEFEMRRDGDRVIEIARNHYAVPVVIQWSLDRLDNLAPTEPAAGVVVLPPAPAPDGNGPPVVLTTLAILDRMSSYHRELHFHARFGDPDARPKPYAYRLPYRTGKTFSVLQGFHGAFSHRGSNEYAVDFDCPVATHVVATRPGIIVAVNASAQGAGVTPEFLEYKRTNFVLVLHDDGTLGEYMHLAPSGVEVRPGMRVKRGDELARSGYTGFSSTPHLHFQVMTAADDGIAAQSFPFQFAVSPTRDEEPVQGRAYPSWE